MEFSESSCLFQMNFKDVGHILLGGSGGHGKLNLYSIKSSLRKQTEEADTSSSSAWLWSYRCPCSTMYSSHMDFT